MSHVNPYLNFSDFYFSTLKNMHSHSTEDEKSLLYGTNYKTNADFTDIGAYSAYQLEVSSIEIYFSKSVANLRYS